MFLMLAACQQRKADDKPAVQSPQLIALEEPALEPAVSSAARKDGDWCFVKYDGKDWRLCNIHYHRPAEHGKASNSGVVPACEGAGTAPDDWVEIHYVYVQGRSSSTCDQLKKPALDEHASKLGEACLPPFVVRAVWARVKPGGTLKPKAEPLPDSARYAEYDGSSTGGSDGKFPVHWKINRECRDVAEEALAGIPKDPTRPLQPAPAAGKPQTTTGN